MSYTVHQAKTNLSRLIKEAEGGKEVIITRGKTPVVRLVALPATAAAAVADRTPATNPGLDPLTDEELNELGLL
jgi:prevent-host-death family protein